MTVADGSQTNRSEAVFHSATGPRVHMGEMDTNLIMRQAPG